MQCTEYAHRCGLPLVLCTGRCHAARWRINLKEELNYGKSIPPNVVAVGVPCKVLREISENNKTTYPRYKELHL